LKDSNGEISGVLGTYEVITEQKRAEELLIQSEKKYRTFVESMHEGVVFADLKENVVYANQGLSKLLGYNADELIGMNFRELVKDGEIDIIYRETQRRINKEYSRYELTIKRKDGQFRQVVVSATPLLDNNGHVNGTVGVFSDITELKMAESEKQELREKLARAQRMESLGVLAGGVAHDLNNILGPLVAYPELIRMKLPPDSNIKNEISRIEKSAQRAADVVQDLLTMARRGRYEMSPQDINELIESYLQSADFINLKSKVPEIEITTALDNSNPKINGSASHVFKVIMNLVINAFDAMPYGGRLHISTQTKFMERLIGGYDNIERGDYIVLTVSDTGVGIEKKDFKRIFEPFYTKKEMGRSGSGLGLAIVYGVIKDHNGYIDVTSEVGQGSQFTIYIPLSKGTPTEAKMTVADIRGCESILVVDDIEEQRELASTVLTSLGYTVATAANGRKAVEHIKNSPADIVILDMIMEPDFDGLDTYREIIKHCPGQRAIIASGFSETDRVKEAERLGVGKYIKKPYNMQILGKAIRELMIA
jgi:two-component system cell cycle sensor histidine kinase/response regulator CckA